MPRARNIKPSFFLNEDLVEIPFSTRLLFIGLWTIADREGRLADKPKQIKMAIFPADDVDVDKGLTELAETKFIERYEVKGDKYIEVTNFTKHQHPHVKEGVSTIPAPGKHRASTRQKRPLIDSLLLIPESKTDSGLLIPESTHSDSGSGVREFPEVEIEACPEHPELSFAEQVLDGIRSELGILQLTNEPLWLIEIERAQKNGFSVEHCLETFRLMRQQKWRNSPVKFESWSDNLPNLEKLRDEIENQNGKTYKSAAERSGDRAVENQQLIESIRNGEHADAVSKLFGGDDESGIKGHLTS